MEFLEGNWTEADEGIWEVRSDRRHFVHSKVMAWVAADRAVKAVEHFGLDGPVDRWRRLRQDIFDEVCAKGWDSQRRTFTQYYGSSELDASLLMIPLVGFLPAGDERMLGTVKAIEAELCIEGVTESIRGELAHQGSHVRIGMVQLPAVNTPQFDWVLSRLPRRAQPVPPIYRPELMARAVVRMAERPRREMWLTGTTIKVIMGNRLAPLYLDRRLGRTGVAAQQTSEPADPDRPSNLWQPVPGDFGAEGAFGDRSRAGDVFAWATLHRPALTAAGLITTAAAAATRLLGRARRPSAPRC